MAKGLGLTIGLNAVDPKHYQGWSGELSACEADAHDMADIAKSCEFEASTLLTKQATRKAVTQAITAAASALKTGDIFLLTYSGHGGQIPDKNGDEPDGLDETWCLYDGELIDDELYAALGSFDSGVRVLVFSDSCHSGSVVKVAYYVSRTAEAARDTAHGMGSSAPKPAYRFMPSEVALRTYEKNRAFYDPILSDKTLKAAQAKVKASVLLISGCQDNQLSADGTFNGLFTGTLRQVWNSGKFRGDYRAFHRKIVHSMPPDQTPNYFKVGAHNLDFEHQRPFAVNSKK